MSLSVADTFRSGVSETFSKTGLTLAVLLSFSLAIYLSGVASLVKSWGGTFIMYEPLILSLPDPVLAAVAFGGALLTDVFIIGSARMVQHEVTDYIPIEFFTDNIVMAVVNLFIAGVIFAILTTIGWMLFILPGIYLSATLIYFIFFVSVEDQNFYSSLKNSFSLTRGNALESTFVLILIGFASFVMQVVGFIGFFLPPAILTALMLFMSGLFMVFTLAVLADAYNQMKEAT